MPLNVDAVEEESGEAFYERLRPKHHWRWRLRPMEPVEICPGDIVEFRDGNGGGVALVLAHVIANALLGGEGRDAKGPTVALITLSQDITSSLIKDILELHLSSAEDKDKVVMSCLNRLVIFDVYDSEELKCALACLPRLLDTGHECGVAKLVVVDSLSIFYFPDRKDKRQYYTSYVEKWVKRIVSQTRNLEAAIIFSRGDTIKVPEKERNPAHVILTFERDRDGDGLVVRYTSKQASRTFRLAVSKKDWRVIGNASCDIP